jgi:hypothetical protein
MPGDRRRPPGSNAVTAIGIVLVLVQWGLTAVLAKPFLDGPSGSGMIDPKAFLVFIVCGVELLVAAIVAGRVWVAIGPSARSVLRPLGVLGPWPLLFITGFAALYVVALLAAPFLPKTPEPATSGRNWRFANTSRYGATYEQAVELCEKSGERVPRREDLAAFDPPFPGGTIVWLEKAADKNLMVVPDGQVAQGAPQPGQAPSRYHVVCFRP